MSRKLTAEIKQREIPALYTQENNPDPTVYLKLELFGFPWRWFVTECNLQEDGHDILFFGYVCGFANEWGYFYLSELEKSRCPILVDNKFKPMPFSEVKKEYQL
jgi:hypothetical protein